MKVDLFKQLGYLTTRELWVLMSELKVPYCNVEDVEKENKETGEMVKVPKFVPRTDYEEMKSDIVIAWNKCNRERRRELQRWLDKATKSRMKCAPPSNFCHPTENRSDEE